MRNNQNITKYPYSVSPYTVSGNQANKMYVME